jgi:hypothetical protein
MLTLRHFLLVIVTLGLIPGAFVNAADKNGKSAMYQMAEIMHRLKHYPSPQGIDMLKKITQDTNTTANERTLATAMINLQHKAASSDIPKLKALIKDKKATADERALANIILNLDHRPSKQDKARLKAMMQ